MRVLPDGGKTQLMSPNAATHKFIGQRSSRQRSSVSVSQCVCVCVCVVLIICMNLMLTAGPDQHNVDVDAGSDSGSEQRHFGARQAVCLIHKELLMGHTTAPKTKARPQLPSFCQSVHLSHPFIHLSLYLYIYLSKHRTYLCIYLVIHPCNILPQTVLSFPLFPRQM